MKDLGTLFDEKSRELHFFYKRVGKIWLYEDFEFLGLAEDFPLGMCFPDRVSRLLEFCSENPGYHVLSGIGHRTYNQYLPNAERYYIGSGDQDPSLMFDLLDSLSAEQFLQVGYTKFASVVGKVKRSEDT